MPRPQRPDLQPIIHMRDFAEHRRRARLAINSEEVRVLVYSADRPARFLKTYEAFHRWTQFLGAEGETIDYEVLQRLLSHVEFADARPQGPPDRNRFVEHRLVRCGCRAVITQAQLAAEIGCSEERVGSAIKQLRKCCVIVNWGKGWNEFDANFFWKGNEEIRRAYVPVQQDFTAIEVVHEGYSMMPAVILTHSIGDGSAEE